MLLTKIAYNDKIKLIICIRRENLMAELYRDNRTFFGLEDDTWIALAVWAILTQVGILNSINGIVDVFVESHIWWDTAAVRLMSGFFILVGTMAAIKRMERRIFILVVLVAFLWFLSYLTNENARMLLKIYYFESVMVYGLCGIICIGHFNNWNKFIEIGKYFVFFGIVLFIPLTFLIVNGDSEQNYMSFSYNNIVFVVGAYWLGIRRKNILMFVLGGLGTVLIIIGGCRGAVVSIAAYVVLEFVLNKKIHIAAKIVFVIAVTLLYLNLENLILGLDEILQNFDYDSRTVKLFLEGKIESDSGRSNVFDAAIEVIKDSPIIGRGMAGGSRFLIKQLYGVEPYLLQHGYSHNLFLELWMEYGVILGTFFIGWIIVSIIMAYLKNRKTGNDIMLYFLLAITLPKLMVTGTYLSEIPFFVLLGLLVNLNCYDKEIPWENKEVATHDK